MPVTLRNLPFDNRYARLHPAFFEVIDPAPLPNPRVLAWSPDAAALLDLAPDTASDPESLRYLAGHARIPGSEPIATGYAGHQFGVWVPELGDGRAILLGEATNARGERWELQLKGAGQTRYSRSGDGRSVLRSAIREFLASEAMAALGIPTARALAVVGSDEIVYRELAEPAATLLRLAPTHVRFGTFQLFAARGQTDRVRELADHVIDGHFGGIAGRETRYVSWLEQVVEQTARLVAEWMAVGFVHGVLNTDNMSVVGITLDYGPYAFLDEYDPGFVANHSDPEGRYAYARQPAIGIWNLARFAESLLSLMRREDAEAALDQYSPTFERHYAARMRAKLGLETARTEDAALIADLLGLLARARIDYTRFFRALAHVQVEATDPPAALLELGGDAGQHREWLERYRNRLRAEASADAVRADRLRRTNPKFILRNYLAQTAIDAARRGEWSETERLRAVLSRPFDEQPEHERYAGPPPAWARELVVSCSS